MNELDDGSGAAAPRNDTQFIRVDELNMPSSTANESLVQCRIMGDSTHVDMLGCVKGRCALPQRNCSDYRDHNVMKNYRNFPKMTIYGEWPVADNLAWLNSTTTLVFAETKFDERKVTLALPPSLTDISLRGTNAKDLAFTSRGGDGDASKSASPRPAELQIKNMDFRGTVFDFLPRCLYEAQLQQDFINITYVVELSLNLTDGSSLAFTRGLNFTNPTNLSQPQYDNAVTNLGTSYEKIFVNGSCTIGMVVCRSTASAGSAASQASSNPAPTPQPAQASSSSKMGSTTGAVFGTIGGLVVVAAIIGFIITRRRKRPQSASCDEAMAPIYNAHSSTTPLAMDRAMDKSFDDPEPLGATTIPQEEITLQGAIVGGDNLHSALWQDRLVVLQRFPAQAVTQRILQGAQKHAALLSTVKHPNILEFYGIAKIGGVDLSLIAESSELGSLRSVLVDANVHLDQADRLRMCLDVARALQYLHGAGRYMHMRQLTSRHVLVTDAQHRCKLDVFECQAIAASEPRVNDSFGTGTLAWTAPELLTRSPHVDQRHCNVFSLGVVMCEVLTRSLPYQNSMDAIGHTCADLSLIVRVRRGVKLEPHEHHPEFLNVSYRLRETIESCLEINPKKRPTAEAVVLELEHELVQFGGSVVHVKASP